MAAEYIHPLKKSRKPNAAANPKPLNNFDLKKFIKANFTLEFSLRIKLHSQQLPIKALTRRKKARFNADSANHPTTRPMTPYLDSPATLYAGRKKKTSSRCQFK